MPRIPFVAGNWKMNTTKATATALARGVAQGAPAPSKV
jgi:triosephosphate isomerase